MAIAPAWSSLIPGLVASLAVSGIWLGYPAWMWMRARWAPRPIRPDRIAASRRSVTIVLATRASVDAVVARVQNLLATDHPADHVSLVVAVDGDAEPVAAALAALAPTVRVVPAEAPGGKAAALNAGVRVASGDLLVFADTAQLFDHRTIPELVAALEDPAFGAVSGLLVLPRDASPLRLYWALETFLRRQEALVHASIGVSGAVYAMRRALWQPLPAGTILDDVYIPMRLVLDGWRIGVIREAKAWDSRRFDAGAEITRKTRTQTGVLQLLQLLPAVRSARNPVRGAFLMHKLARLTTPLWMLVLLLSAGPWLLSPLVALGRPGAVAGLAVLAGGLVWPRGRRWLRDGVVYALALQWALLRALLFGTTGRWAVWDHAAPVAGSGEQSGVTPPRR